MSDLDKELNEKIEIDSPTKSQKRKFSKDPKKKFICHVCEKPTLNQCSRCRDTFYCSLEHQLTDWEFHKSKCLNSTIEAGEANFSNKRSNS